VYVRDGESVGLESESADGTLRKSQMSIVSSCELLTIWNSSNCRRNTRPVCSWNTAEQSANVYYYYYYFYFFFNL